MPEYITKVPTGMVEHFAKQPVPWGPVGYIVYKRTYSRFREDLGRAEEWSDTIERGINGILEIGGKFTEDEIFRLFGYYYDLKGCFSGRALWQLGTNNVHRIGADSLQNCWCVSVSDPIDPFCFTFNQLMLGGGVGFNILPENVYGLPTVAFNPTIKRVETFDCDFIVPDNREGWVKLLGRILKSFFYSGKDFTYCTKGIRSKGSPISTFGGKASGDADLIWGMEEIMKILRRRVGRKLRPIDCLDILNIIGKIVVAGNVRRSAEIAIGDPRDLEYMAAKNWATGKVPAWRGMSNNSVAAAQVEVLPEAFWSGYNGDGEAYGLVNLDLARRFGRLLDGDDYRCDPYVIGTNPCGEITLAHKEPCNLTEMFVCRITDLREFKDVAYLNYKVAKTISKWPFSDPDTNDIVQMHHRLGCGVTGVQQATWWGPKEYDAVYRHMEEADEVYSKLLNVKKSIKLTTVKPSGTLSLLANFKGGVLTPGTNDGYSPFHIRRIRFASDDPLVDVCRDHGYSVEPAKQLDGTEDYNTLVVSFPVAQHGAKQTSALHQLKRHKLMQTYWADNSVSTTVYYQRDELPSIKKYLEQNLPTSIKSVSFLLHSDHGFEQAPLEAITQQQYEAMASRCKPITHLAGSFTSDLSLECEGGHCPIK